MPCSQWVKTRKKITEMFKPQCISDHCGSKDLVLLESVEENKGEIETKNEKTVQEGAVFSLTKKSKRKRKSRSKRKTQTSDAMATQLVPRNNALEKPSSDIPVEAAIAPGSVPIRALDYTNHKDKYWEKGDVVSIADTKGGRHYALIRKILMYKNSDKGVLINWLLPKRVDEDCDPSITDEDFDPSIYRIGPEEDSPINIEYLKLIMTLPLDYYSIRGVGISRQLACCSLDAYEF